MNKKNWCNRHVFIKKDMVKAVYLISIFIWCKTKQKIYLLMHKKVFFCMILSYFSYLLVANFKGGQFNFVFIV